MNATQKNTQARIMGLEESPHAHHYTAQFAINQELFTAIKHTAPNLPLSEDVRETLINAVGVAVSRGDEARLHSLTAAVTALLSGSITPDLHTAGNPFSHLQQIEKMCK